MKRKIPLGKYFLIYGVCLVLSALISFLALYFSKLWIQEGVVQVLLIINWVLFWFVFLSIAATTIFSHILMEGKVQEVVVFIFSELLISAFVSFVFYALIKAHFDFNELNWYGFLRNVVEFKDYIFYLIFGITFVLFSLIYILTINRKILLIFRVGLKGKGKLKSINANLENSRWMNEKEKNANFKLYKYSNISNIKKDGIPVLAELTDKSKDLKIRFSSPCHSLVIGSTGSGKTTTFVSPMIQILASTNAGSSMIITDPKGELFNLHSKYLQQRGYDVKVIDLRDTYSSYHWNPLECIFDNFDKYKNAYKEAFSRSDDPEQSGLTLANKPEEYSGEWYEFNGTAYATYDRLLTGMTIYRKKIYDEVYEDLNDLVTVLIPVENEKDPTWEKGARSITLAVLLAMLEDYHYGKYGMSKEKFNFFNLTKILQNSSNDYIELRRYFAGRNPLSRAASLAKQVIDAAPQTRASYMSIVYEKLTLFNDSGICALTSSSDFDASQLALKPTALFLKIPDEKDTRHNLAAIFILNIYKTLIKVASNTKDLTLERNVYFIMDEFGNMPKIEKFDKFITVGRSRKIWFNMIVQSYSQLNNVYGETIADIVKGNCGIKMFIGSNDMNTCKEYSELCGNITVVTNTTSSSIHSTDLNISSQTQVRPLIYPSELQRLNHPGDIGHSIIVTFGNYPLKTYFSPSFKVPFYKFGAMNISELNERVFDEKAVYYDISVRNKDILDKDSANNGTHTEIEKEENNKKGTSKKEKHEETVPNADVDNFIEQFRIWKKDHPTSSIEDYFVSQKGNPEASQGGNSNE